MRRGSIPTLAGATSLGLIGAETHRSDPGEPITVFLCGDVMTGRGIDQVLPYSVDPRLHEPVVGSARDYVDLAEGVNGTIPLPVDASYIWGDALAELERIGPDARIINLETAVTNHDRPWPRKGIHYRMHPGNVACLTVAGIDACVLANNHVLDWGYPGLEETLATLRGAGLRTAGAGFDLQEASAPAILAGRNPGRVLVLALGHESSGIPRAWAAGQGRAGVHLLDDLSERSVETIAERIRSFKQPGDVVVASVHWGDNWGYEVPGDHRAFARRLVERAEVDVIHGHSSHHPKGIEVHRNRPILYGCGDFINDYEGIEGYEEFRGDMSLMYFLRLDAGSGRLVSLEMVPMRIRQFRLHRASATDARWLAETLDRECTRLGSSVQLGTDHRLNLRWA